MTRWCARFAVLACLACCAPAWAQDATTPDLASSNSATAPSKPSKPTVAGQASGKIAIQSEVASDGGSGITKWQYQVKKGEGDYSGWINIVASDKKLIFTVHGFENGATYQFKVRAVNAVGNSPDSDESEPVTIPATTPSKPSAFNASGGNASVTLTWTAGSDGGGTLTEWQYSQKAGEGDFGGWNRICRTSDDAECPDTASHTVASLTNGTAYKFKVRAVNLIGNGAASDESASVTPSTTPAKPTSLTVSDGSETVNLSWTAGDNGGSAITGWKYQQKEGNNDWGGWTAVPNSGASTTSYTVTGLTNGATYKFKVRAVNANGDGTPSDESASVSPEVGLVTLTASEITRTSATLTLANHTGGWSYKSTAAHSPCNAVAAGTTEVSLTDLTAGTIYNYVAFSSSTCGPTSAEIARETFTTLAAANLTASAVGATTATLTIGNHPAAWWYKRTAPTGDNTCHSVPANDDDDDLSNLASGTSHTYKAYSDSSCSVELASETFLTKPGQTTGVSLDPGSTEIGVSWTEVTGAASYKVQWKLSSDDDYNTGNRQKEVTPGTSTSTSITGLTNATEYTVRVAAVNRTGDGEWSDEASATPKAITLTATNVAQTTATLKIAGYTKAWAFSRTDNPTCTTVAANTPTKNVSDLTANTKYTYHAFSGTECVTSLKIAEHTFTTLNSVTLTASAVGATTATLTIGNHPAAWWYKRTAPTGDNTCHSVPANDDDDDLSNLASGTSHTYKAYSDSSCSVELASAPPFLTKPGKTTDLKVSYRSGELRPSWTAVTGATGYKVQWATDGTPPNWNSNQQATVSSPSHDVGSLTNGTTYAVRVAATNGTGDGAWSDKATATPQEITFMVDEATITDTKASLTVSGWTKAWWYISNESGAQCTAVPANTAKVDLAGLTPSTDYTITAYDFQGCATSTPIVQVTFTTKEATQTSVSPPPSVSEPAITVPEAPPAPVASAGNRLATLNWTAGGDGGLPVTGWEYRQRQPGGDWGAWTGICTAASDTGCASRGSHTVTGLTNGTTYTFQVRAVNAVGSGLASAESNEATPTAPPPNFSGVTINNRTYQQNAVIEPAVLPAASGGDGTLTYALSPALPSGLSFDAATRTLSGTPTATAVPSTYTYTATDANGDHASLTFTLKVVISAEEKAMLQNGLAAQGRALLSGATGVIGERFRNPGALSWGQATACAGAPPEAAAPRDDASRGLGTGRDATEPGEEPQPEDCTTGVLAAVTEAVLGMMGGGAPGPDSLDLADADETRPRGPRASDVDAQPAWDWESLVWGRSFAVPLQKSGTPGSAWTLWGAGDIQGFQGAPGAGRYDGQVRSLYLGVDAQWQEQWLAGAALAQSWGKTDYGAGGQLETSLTSLYPYVRGTLGAGLEVWAMGGYGRGEAENTRPGEAGAVETSDLSMAMGATGARQPMTEWGGVQLAVVGGAGYLSLATDAGDSLVPDLDVAVQRARLAVEATWTAGGLAPYVQVGGRYDGGAGQTGAGLETVAGVRYTSERLEFEARGRWLATHAADGYEEYGGLARLAVKPRADGTGWQMNVAPRWGAADGAGLLGGGAALLDGGAMPGLGVSGMSPATPRGLVLESDLGYGFAVFERHGILTPYGGFAFTGDETRQYRLGARLGVAEWLNLSLEGSRREATGQQPADQGVQLTLQGRF